MGCLPGSLETARSVQKLQKHSNKVVAAGDPELWAVCAERLAGGFREPSHLSPSGGRFCSENGQTKGPLLSATPRQRGTQGCGFPLAFLSWVRTCVFSSGVESLSLAILERREVLPQGPFENPHLKL